MDTLFQTPTVWFTVPALLGTLLFLLKIALLMMGADGDGDFDVGGADGADATGSDAAFTILSIQSLSAIAMGFGWGGLGSFRGAGLDVFPSIMIGLACGFAMVWLLSISLKAVYDLQSSGNVSLESMLGAGGVVTATVPADGAGKGRVRLIVQNRERRCAAVSDGEAIPTSARVIVTRVNKDNTVTVTPTPVG